MGDGGVTSWPTCAGARSSRRHRRHDLLRRCPARRLPRRRTGRRGRAGEPFGGNDGFARPHDAVVPASCPIRSLPSWRVVRTGPIAKRWVRSKRRPETSTCRSPCGAREGLFSWGYRESPGSGGRRRGTGVELVRLCVPFLRGRHRRLGRAHAGSGRRLSACWPIGWRRVTVSHTRSSWWMRSRSLPLKRCRPMRSRRRAPTWRSSVQRRSWPGWSRAQFRRRADTDDGR